MNNLNGLNKTLTLETSSELSSLLDDLAHPFYVVRREKGKPGEFPTSQFIRSRCR